MSNRRLDLRRDVLDKGAAGGDVQHLHPAADCEQRDVGVESTPGQIDLELVAAGLRIVDGGMALLLVECGVYVPSTGEEHAVDFADDGTRALRHFKDSRRCSRGLEGRDVVVQPAAAAHADDRVHISLSDLSSQTSALFLANS